jgi:hypothetical protein
MIFRRGVNIAPAPSFPSFSFVKLHGFGLIRSTNYKLCGSQLVILCSKSQQSLLINLSRIFWTGTASLDELVLRRIKMRVAFGQ